MSNEFWAGLIGAVVGALVSGVISLAIQLMALRAVAKDRNQDALEKQRTLAHAFLFKMIQIHSHFRILNDHLKKSIASARRNGFKGQLWQMILPIMNPPDRVEFSTSEMAMLLSLKDNDLFNDIAAMDAVHNSTVAAFRFYSERRFALTSTLSAVMQGNVGTTMLTEEQAQFLEPKSVELNSVLEQIIPACERDEGASRDALERLGKLLSAKLGLAVKLTIKPLTS